DPRRIRGRCLTQVRIWKAAPMAWGAATAKRVALEIAGWTLVLAGIAALVLPGPGLLMLFGGMVILSQQYEWAERRLAPIERRALQTAAEGVRTWPRIIGSALGATWLIGIG